MRIDALRGDVGERAEGGEQIGRGEACDQNRTLRLVAENPLEFVVEACLGVRVHDLREFVGHVFGSIAVFRFPGRGFPGIVGAHILLEIRKLLIEAFHLTARSGSLSKAQNASFSSPGLSGLLGFRLSSSDITARPSCSESVPECGDRVLWRSAMRGRAP